MSGLAILLMIEIVLFAFAFLLSGRDIMAPSVVVSVMFILSTGVALMNADYWNVSICDKTTIIISSGLFSFILAEILFRFIICRQLRGNTFIIKPNSEPIYENTVVLNILIILNSFICLLYLVKIISVTGASSLTDSFSIYRNMMVSKLSEGDSDELIPAAYVQLTKLVIATGYVSCYLFSNDRLYRKMESRGVQVRHLILIFLSVVPSICAGGRSGTLRVLSAWIILYYIVWHQKNGWDKSLSLRYIRYGIIGLLVAIPIFYYMLDFIGRSTEDVDMADYVSTYLSSSIIMFDQYVQSPVPRDLIGEESLFSVLKATHYLGWNKMPSSYNLEFRPVGDGFSNVYTFFRRPLHDFGLVGMYLFTILVSFLFSWIYFKKIKYRHPRQCNLWVLLYGYLYYWLILFPIDQYSQSYVSFGTLSTVIVICILFRMMAQSSHVMKETGIHRISRQ